jgi:hypothetical protein
MFISVIYMLNDTNPTTSVETLYLLNIYDPLEGIAFHINDPSGPSRNRPQHATELAVLHLQKRHRPFEIIECFIIQGIEFREDRYHWNCDDIISSDYTPMKQHDLPLPVPHSEKKLISALVKGLLSSIGMQYLHPTRE